MSQFLARCDLFAQPDVPGFAEPQGTRRDPGSLVPPSFPQPSISEARFFFLGRAAMFSVHFHLHSGMVDCLVVLSPSKCRFYVPSTQLGR